MNTTRGALFADCIQKHEELSKFFYAQCNYDMKKRTTQLNMEALCDMVSAFSRHCTFSGLFVPWYNDSAYINRCGTCNSWIEISLEQKLQIVITRKYIINRIQKRSRILTVKAE